MYKKPLLTSFSVGEILLKNRIVMAPLTRGRAINQENIATPIIAEYYRQRATAGLIISEGSQVSKMAVGYGNTPGIYSENQTEAWKQVTNAVHEEGGKIFIQLWHVGRLSHPVFLDGNLPWAPSAVEINYLARTPGGPKPAPTPHEMTVEEIKQVVKEFKDGAKNALEAGFDGVEIHASNGYLIHQFIAPCSNVRTDEYGGSVENRSRFLLEIIEEMKSVIPENKIGVRLNPSYHQDHDMVLTQDTIPTFDYLINKLNNFDLAYLHLSEPGKKAMESSFAEKEIAKRYRPIYKGNLMINKGFTFETGNEVIEENLADLVAYGIPFISNPDLVRRFEIGAPIADADPVTFYSPGEKGFIDYPKID
jgi:N-ethylmaleimide reductase